MLPAVTTIEATGRRMVAYSAALWATTLVIAVVADLGWIYTAAAIVLGAVFTWGCVDLVRRPSAKRSMRVFGFSITYVTLLFGALAVDILVLA
jgi:protoheme IX farnesyltransferase